MRIQQRLPPPRAEFVRYLLNGVVATLIHFGVLSYLIKAEILRSAGLANVLAAIVGIACSFLGSRYFVFQHRKGHVFDHALKFIGLYGAIALLNGGVLFIWTDLLGHDYRPGFLIATVLQVLASYSGNKHFVFKENDRMGTKFIRLVIASTFFVLLLLVFNLLHARFVPVNVVFYAAIGDAFLAGFLTLLLLLTVPYFRIFGGFEKAQMLMIFLLAGYAFAISVPTVIDRSLSFYILEKLQQRGGGIRADQIGQVFIGEYLPEHRLVDVRLTEQAESGTIEIVGGCVRLTSKGERIASASRFYRQNFLPKKRLLMGEYTDDLTNPFRHSIPDPGYGCK